jgi:hypothetical protein
MDLFYSDILKDVRMFIRQKFIKIFLNKSSHFLRRKATVHWTKLSLLLLFQRKQKQNRRWKMGKEYTWFLEPLDSITNNALASELAETNFLREAICSDGEKRNLWQCEYPLVNAFIRSRRIKNFKFNVFIKEGGGGIRKWNLYPKKKPKKTQ